MDGGIVAFGSGGALLGSLVADPIIQRLGMRMALRWAIVTSAAGLLLIPVAGGNPTQMIVIFALGFGINGIGLAALNIYLRSIRQQTVPAAMMGRVLASYICFSMGAVPVGALLAGTASLIIGIHNTLIFGAMTAFFAIPWIWNMVVPSITTSQTTLSGEKYRKGKHLTQVYVTRPVTRSFPLTHPHHPDRELDGHRRKVIRH